MALKRSTSCTHNTDLDELTHQHLKQGSVCIPTIRRQRLAGASTWRKPVIMCTFMTEIGCSKFLSHSPPPTPGGICGGHMKENCFILRPPSRLLNKYGPDVKGMHAIVADWKQSSVHDSHQTDRLVHIDIVYMVTLSTGWATPNPLIVCKLAKISTIIISLLVWYIQRYRNKAGTKKHRTPS